MPEITYRDLPTYLADGEAQRTFPVYLLHGEEVLYKTALDAVLKRLLPESDRTVNYVPVDHDDVYEAIERVNTYSLLSVTKVVSLPESRIFYSKGNNPKLLEKVREAFEADEMKKAAEFFSGLLGMENLSLGDVAEPAAIKKNLKPDPEIAGDGAWLTELVRYCMEESVDPSPPQDSAGDLQRAVEKGFARGNHLIITADMVDRRRGLYKAIRDHGMIVDCSVPQGSRKADRSAQDALLHERARAILSKLGKALEPAAFQAMREMLGFDLRAFTVNLEKLADYTEDRRITVDDVRAVLKRTKKDPIYELTGAVADRNLPAALFYLETLLSENLFPLQILAAIANQVRKLILAKGFVESPDGKVWQKGMGYPRFQNQVMDSFRRFDRRMEERMAEWTDLLSYRDGNRAGGKSSFAPGDLLIAKSSKSPYPVYQTLLKSDRFTRHELFEILESLSNADLRLKTTGQNPVRILETLIIRICTPFAADRSAGESVL